MSCTENDSGPFVVFFLPAVVGCLTILLARRWANSQVSSTSSTAVSRRRKIIKDPLIKRPLPPIACKMVPPPSKKSSGFAKKGSLPVLDEDMNGGGKRSGRTARTPSGPTPTAVLADFKSAEGPAHPKHIPFPYIPQDGILLFETMTFVFALVTTGLQFLNLYRTVWWLPHSYTNQTMNFYLIDPHLVAFIVTVVSRRFVLAATVALLRVIASPKLLPHAIATARMLILGVVVGMLGWCSYFILLKHSVVELFYLWYPAVIYLVLFGFQVSPILELNPDPPPLHCCSSDPQQVRAEVEVLRQDFNMRVKKILFNSIVGAYYTSFVPCCFAQTYLHYDIQAASQQVAFVWGGLFGRYAQQLMSATHCDVSHRAALHLGRWRQHNDGADSGDSAVAWNGTRLWAVGALVAARGALWAAAAPCVAAEPGHAHHKRFHAVFLNPSVLMNLLMCLQLAFVVLELCFLFSSLPWHNYLAILILLFINYYTLFKLMRDYLVSWKVYKAESMIQDRNFNQSN